MRVFLLNKKWWLVALALVLATVLFTFSTQRTTVDFNAQVKPLLNKKCITCHGGVRRKGDFSLLFRVDALAKTESGKPAIIPGDPDHSEMIRRLTLTDPEERMPYKHEPLSADEIHTLKQWIREGAPWGDHWAYVPVKPVELPVQKTFFNLLPSSKPEWIKNNIDYFIYQKLAENKLPVSPEADKATLLRRVSLDLTGLPASESVAKQYLQSNDAHAYEILVDSLLSSPHFGERWASMWMDLSRYADTKGYERDGPRSIWRYRDWLIRSFNEDKPYNIFLQEQLAGDLMPDVNDDKLIATAFHRNTMTNDEGGTDNEEFRTAATLDRVNTTWEALMGTTFSCVQCHSHPYDPFTHDEYYKFLAFFNDTRDEDTYDDYPLLRVLNDSLKDELRSLEEWLSTQTSRSRVAEVDKFIRTWQPSINSLTADQIINSALNDTKWLVFRNHGIARLNRVDLSGSTRLIFRYASYETGGTWTMHLDSARGAVLAVIRAPKTKDWTIAYVDYPEQKGVHNIYLTYENPKLKKPEDSGLLFDWFHFTTMLPGKGKPDYAKHEKSFWHLVNAPVQTIPIMMENPSSMHRNTNIFERGNWLVKGKIVQPDVPHALNPMPAGAPRNRLGMAMWLTSKENPLTSRTIVNRLWEQLFGTGLAETLEDLGTQGMPPTHRELLDYLSWQLMNEYNWSIKKLLKEMVMSATYRQDSRVTPELQARDPFNKFYGRGARVRLSAEQVRDQALAASGLLSEKMFGPSVMPYQPKGIWLSPWNGQDWVASQGKDMYRRALYTYWKRTAPYPSMITFDGAAREVCTARRIRTNTPLQALVTLNDSAYLDIARHFSYRMQKLGGRDVGDMINAGYELLMNKKIDSKKQSILIDLYQSSLKKFSTDGDAACEMIGEMNEHTGPEAAALVVVANAMLNLDEVVTKN